MAKAGSLRKRYVLFEYRSGSGSMDAESLKRSLYAEALRFFGEFGLSRVALKLVEYDEGKKSGIIRCERASLDEVLGFLALLDSLEGKPARILPKASSGTIKGLDAH
jgi:RNase P/RNase MRP subunit POP5